MIETLRQFKILNYAVFDFAVSFIFIYFIAPTLTKIFRYIKLEVPLKSWLLLTIPLSILTHVLVGNITPMTKDFLNLNNSYLLKIVIILMIVFGVLPIKKIKTNGK
jgi:hypothetical protein